jgi:hypothetical protein
MRRRTQNEGEKNGEEEIRVTENRSKILIKI